MSLVRLKAVESMPSLMASCFRADGLLRALSPILSRKFAAGKAEMDGR